MKKQFFQREGFQLFFWISIPIIFFLISFRQEIAYAWDPFISMLQVLRGAEASTHPITPDVTRSVTQVLINIFGYISIFLLSIFFVSLFVLPVQTLPEQIKIFSLLLSYLTKQHGPAIFVQSGKEISSQSELKRKGRGVVLVDLNSAVVLESQGSQPKARVEGAGVVITKRNEKIRGVADLRAQSRMLKEIHCHTRDGIEITTNIFSTFTLGEAPDILYVTYNEQYSADSLQIIQVGDEFIKSPRGTKHQVKMIKALLNDLDQDDQEDIHRYYTNFTDTNTDAISSALDLSDNTGQYVFNPQRIFSALYSQPKGIQFERKIDWTDLPIQVAADYLRQLISEIFFDDFYNPVQNNPHSLKDLKTKFSWYIRSQGVLAYQLILRKDGKLLTAGTPWDESQFIIYPVQEFRQPKVLRARGIKVISASFSELQPVNPVVRETHLQNWRARKERDIETNRAENEYQAMQIRNKARREAQTEMIRRLAQILNSSPVSQEAVAIQLFQALESASTDPATHKLLPADTINLLRSLRTWIFPRDNNPHTPANLETDGPDNLEELS